MQAEIGLTEAAKSDAPLQHNGIELVDDEDIENRVEATDDKPNLIPMVLTIAGSDSSGGAGIQADLKTFTNLGVYGSTVVTAVTAQNSLGVHAVYPIPIDVVRAQLHCILTDYVCRIVKTGMLATVEIVTVVAELLEKFSVRSLIVDPVIVSTSGHRLLDEDAIEIYKSKMLPLAFLLTPNIAEAEALTGMTIKNAQDIQEACRRLHAMGSRHVLLKGGHLPVTNQEVHVQPDHPDAKWVIDTLYDGKKFREFRNAFVRSANSHGTGCTLSAAIAACISKSTPLTPAINKSIKFVNGALQSSYQMGHGSGSVNHMHRLKATSLVKRLQERAAPMTNQNDMYTFPASRPFTHTLYSGCKDIWQHYIEHPFVRGLADGTLPHDCFIHYLRQDYIFLKHYARASGMASFRADEMEDIVEAANLVVQIGREVHLHIDYCKEWGISLEELSETPESSASLAYTRFCLDRGMAGDLLDLKVALAPCLIGYGNIGYLLCSDPRTKREGNPYWAWISNYGDTEFQRFVYDGIELLESLFKNRVVATNERRIKQLKDTFRTATMLEINFWSMGINKTF